MLTARLTRGFISGTVQDPDDSGAFLTPLIAGGLPPVWRQRPFGRLMLFSARVSW